MQSATEGFLYGARMTMLENIIAKDWGFRKKALLGKMQNLQILSKRRTRRTGNFVRVGEKARKNLDMAQQGLSLTKRAGIVFGIPFFLAFALKTDVFATPPKPPEGSGTNITPAALKVPAEKPPCADMTTCSRKEAYRASTGKIVLHYGEGIERIDSAEEGLNMAGYPTVALPGGKPGQVEIFVNKKIPKMFFSQGDLDGGTVGGLAMDLLYKYAPTAKRPPEDLMSLNR